MTGNTILVVDDDRGIRRMLKVSLEANSYKVLEATNIKEAIQTVAEQKPSLIILDLQLPDGNGLEVVKQVRVWTSIPILVLSVLSSDRDKINLLDSGADDYLTKPFSMGELLARIRVSFRHNLSENKINEPILSNGFIVADIANRKVLIEEREIHLTPTEYSFFVFLLKHAGKVLTHQQIIREIWGPLGMNETNTLRVHIASLRKKIEKDPSNPKILLNEPGIGYRMDIL